MKQLFLKPIFLLSLALLPVQSYSQGLQRYTNSLFAEYGLLRYNNDGNEWLGENSNLLSLGLGYHKNISGFLALGFKAKHYEISGPAPYTYNSNTIQLQFRLQRPRISRTFRLRRFNPYLEAGFGHAAEYVNRDVGQSTAVYAYTSLAAGADYNFSDHWSLGLQGEYRLSGQDAASVSDDPGQALNPFNTLSARLNFYFGRNRQRPAVPRIYTRPGTVAPADSMGRRRLDISPVSRELQAAAPDSVPAVPALLQAGTVAIRDTVLVRIVHADAGNRNGHPAGMPEPGPVLPRTDTLAVGDAAIRPQQNLIVSPDTMAGIKQVTTRTDSALTILKQEPVFKKDSNEVIAKIPAPVQGSDTAFPQQSATGEKKDTLLSADTGILPQPDTATILPGSSPARVKQDTVWRTIRDTVSLYRRDTITVFARDTITQLKRDTVVEQANGLLQQQHTRELKSTSEETGGAGTAHLKEQDKQEPANAAQPRTGQDSSPQQTTAPDQQLQQRLKQLESDNAELQTRLQESEARSREQATVNELPAKQAVAPAPTLNLPVWTPGAGGKNSTNLVVLPVGAGGGKKNRDQEELSQEQRRLAKRQDSILHQLSRVQAKLAQLQTPQTDTVAAIIDSVGYADSLTAPDTLVKLPAVKPYADSVQQALQRQIRQLNKENEALQQMVGTISGLRPKEQQGSSDPVRLAAHDVFFNVNQSRPDTLALRQLLAFADTLRTSGAYWILLEGFTDKSGNAAYNLQLSKKRVASVKAVLVEQGIPKESILEKTFGSRFSTGLTNSNDRKVRITQILR